MAVNTYWCFEVLCYRYSELMRRIPEVIKSANDEFFFGDFILRGLSLNDNLREAERLIGVLDFLIHDLRSCWFYASRKIIVPGVPNDIIVIIFSFLDPALKFIKPCVVLHEEHTENMQLLQDKAEGRL